MCCDRSTYEKRKVPRVSLTYVCRMKKKLRNSQTRPNFGLFGGTLKTVDARHGGHNHLSWRLTNTFIKKANPIANSFLFLYCYYFTWSPLLRLMTGGTAMCSVAIITILCISLRAATADDESFTPTIILAHPAAFGRRWSEVVTVALQTANVDLCDGTKIENENANIAFDNSIELYDTAVFFDDPNARIREEGCDYAQIAQAVEKMYPMAQYLLVSSDGLYAMGKSEDAPDTKLALASITLEDVEGSYKANDGWGSVFTRICAVFLTDVMPFVPFSIEVQDSR